MVPNSFPHFIRLSSDVIGDELALAVATITGSIPDLKETSGEKDELGSIASC